MTTARTTPSFLLIAAIAGLGSWTLCDVVAEAGPPALVSSASTGAGQGPTASAVEDVDGAAQPIAVTGATPDQTERTGGPEGRRGAHTLTSTGTSPTQPSRPSPVSAVAPAPTGTWPSSPAVTYTVDAYHANSSFEVLASRLGEAGRSIALSGFEDHSVSVLGNDQIVTYDDSNVFIARNGQINANTGDTDSSGLNAVDVVGSRVRAGNSGDGEGNDDENEDEDEDTGQGEEEEVEEEEATPLPLRTLAGTSQTRTSPVYVETASADAESTDSSDDEDENGTDESAEDGIPVFDLLPGATYATVTDEGASIATGRSSFVVGADGYDDVSIRTRGDRNIVTYDDSNVVIGGTGKVNAQIGDSDTGGAVVMGIYGSDVAAGCEGDLCYPDWAHQPAPR